MVKKVLEICESYGGGVKRQLDYLNKYVDKSRYELITLVSSKRSNDPVPDGYYIDDSMSEIKNPWAIIKSLKTIHKLITKNNINLVHAHSTISGVLMFFYKIFLNWRIRIIFTPHAYFTEVSRGPIKDYLLLKIEKIMNRFFFRIIHVSEEEQDYAICSKLTNKSKSHVINNGVDDPKSLRKDNFKYTFLNVARCSFQKNPRLFIDIAEVAIEFNDNFQFVWVGDGPLLLECINYINTKGLDDNIHFVGYTSNPSDYLKNSDIFLSTSRYEGQPFSVLEALSYRLPVLLTRIIGHTELIKNNGSFLESTDIKDRKKLIAKIQEICDKTDVYSDESYRLFKSKYIVNTMISKIENLYSECMR